MRNLRIAAALMLAITLGGCATGSSIGDVVHAVTTTVTNPVGPTDLYRVKNTYAAALQVTADYRAYCWKAPYSVLMADPVAHPICQNRRPIVRAAQNAKIKAKAAIAAAENFIATNPTLNAASAISAAMRAVTDYRNAIPLAN